MGMIPHHWEELKCETQTLCVEELISHPFFAVCYWNGVVHLKFVERSLFDFKNYSGSLVMGMVSNHWLELKCKTQTPGSWGVD